MFSRLAIVNRGEAAMRLIRAVRELSAEIGAGIETVALYTDADRTATFVGEADLAYPLGPASARPYLDHAVLERALVETEADAVWVGLSLGRASRMLTRWRYGSARSANAGSSATKPHPHHDHRRGPRQNRTWPAWRL